MLCTRARAAGGGSLMNFNFLTPSSRPTETVGPLPSAPQRWVDTPQSGQVEGGGGQRQFYRHLRQPAPTEAPHPALLFQHPDRSEEHTSELQSLAYLVCRLLLEKKKRTYISPTHVV